MTFRMPRVLCTLLLCCLLLTGLGFASAYNGQPKLVVIIVIDQFRGDYLNRAHDEFRTGGFRLFTDQGAWFVNCNYDYANTETAPGHTALLTGAYSDRNGIFSNEWWDPERKRMVTSVWDDTTKLVGVPTGVGASPHNLMADTLGDELKLATQGKSRVFTISLKDRSAVLPGGFSANAAYWIDPASGAWVTSTYYMSDLPSWVRDFNSGGRANKYWDLDWKDADGKVLRHTTRQPAAPRSEMGQRQAASASFYSVIGATPFANDYELEFARELITNEKLGQGPATDLLVISLSATDILGHAVGPDSPEMHSMILTTDRQLADFFGFLGRQIGLANIWMALSADHGVSPIPAEAAKLRLPAARLDPAQFSSPLKSAVTVRLGGRTGDYIAGSDGTHIFLNQEAFAALNLKEAEAERTVGEALKQIGVRGYYTKAQLAEGEVAPDATGRQFLHSYSPLSGWYVVAVQPPYTFPWSNATGTNHGSPYNYDRHVPLAFYGLPFQTGVYRSPAEPVDLVTTLASLLGINPPNSATGRVLADALARRSPAQAAAPAR